MTLFKQMGAAVSLIIITMLGAVMFIQYQTTKEKMIQNVYESSVNNIATLTQTLAQTQGDEAYITTIIDAAFDSGYYKKIAFESSGSDFSYKQEFQGAPSGVPDWFVAFADIEPTSLKESVVAGWSTLGRVEVVGDVSVVYHSLYETFVNLLYLFVISTILSLALLYLLLTYLLKPLKDVQKQAEAILKDEFVFQEKMPYTTEFKEVVRGMNLMVKKVEYIFIKGSEALKRNQELLYTDQDTGLYNRRYLLLKLPELIALENRANGGSMLFMALGGGEILNQKLGRKGADKFFVKLADRIVKSEEEFEEALSARMNGTEFALVLGDCESVDALRVAEALHLFFEELLETNRLDKEEISLDIGIYRYHPSSDITALLGHVDNALAHAKADELSSIYLYEDGDTQNAMGKDQWRHIIEESLQNRELALRFWPVVELRNRALEHSVMTFGIDDKGAKHYHYGDFIAPAIHLGLVSQIYTLALKLLLTNRDNTNTHALYSVRLSSEYLKDPNSYEALANLLKKHASRIPFGLMFEVSDSFVIKNPVLVRRFIELFREYGYRFGINAFSGEAESFEYLKFLNPSFLKADVSFLLDQSRDSMNALQLICDSIGVKIIATSVSTQEQLKTLESLEISRIQGPITDTLT